MTRKFGPLRGRTATFKHHGVTKTVADYGNEPAPGEEITITAWDGKTVVVPETITSISQGHVIPKDGGGTYVVLSDLPEFNTLTELTGETDTGTPVKVNLIPRRQMRGHAKGINYMLPIDKATGFIKFEKGRYGHKYYATKRPRTDPSGKGGYTKQQIADELGVNVSTITDTWIRDNATYGKSENKPLELVTAFAVWNALVSTSGTSRFFQSNWLLVEGGFDYDDFRAINYSGNFLPSGASGESPFHPLLITSYGSGNRPILHHTGQSSNHNEETANWLCYQNVDAGYVNTLGQFSAIYSHVGSIASERYKGGFYLQGGPTAGVDGAGHKTLYRCNGWGSHALPSDADAEQLANNNWGSGGADHVVGVYTASLRSALILENHIDMSGWERGWDNTNRIFADPTDPSTRLPVPPTGLAHNLYLQFDMSDITVIDNICSRAASHAIQDRPGGFVYGNWLTEFNVAGNSLGSSSDPITNAVAKTGYGNYCALIGNVITSSAYKDVPGNMRPPAINWGWESYDRDHEAADNIFMHWANPDDPAEMELKSIPYSDKWMKFSIDPKAPREYAQPLDNCIHRWFHSGWHRYVEENAVAKGADPAVLNTRTTQNFAETQMGSLLNGVAEGEKIHAYFDWMRTLTPAQRVEQLRLFKEYMRDPWGIARTKRTAAGTSVFQPDLRYSGLDWHYDRNWTDEMVPGRFYKDNAQLRGAKVRFGIYTCEMATVDGEGSSLLECVSGRLTVDTLNNIDVVRVRDVSGQLYIKTATNVPTFLVTQGRLVFDCPISGKDLIIDNQYAQVFLGPDYTVSTGKVLDIKIGKQGYIGHKGTGTATLRVQAGGTLRFRWHDYKDDRIRQFAKLERIQEDWSTPASTVTVDVPLEADSNVEVIKGNAPVGSVHDLTGPGYNVVKDPALVLQTGLEVVPRGDGTNKLVYTVPA